MRPNRLLVPLALLIPLVLASPAAAFTWTVDVNADYTFQPPERQIAVGDSVSWNFTVDGHTSTSLSGQPERWDSTPDGGSSTPAGTPFSHTFTTPGRYQYVCIPHQAFMKGVIQVGTDAVFDTINDYRQVRGGNRVKLSFKLNEPATVTYKLKGPSRRTVKRGRLATGRHSFTVRRLKRGSYHGVLTVVDDFDKKKTPRNSFVIR
jgi:plastocyanin